MTDLTGKDLNTIQTLFQYQLNGNGGIQPINDASTASSTNPFWLHIDQNNPDAKEWIRNCSFLPKAAQDILLGDSMRPQMMRLGNSLILVLNAVNQEKNCRPEELVALRIFITDFVIISTQHLGKAVEIDNLLQDLKENSGSINCSDWLIQMADSLTDQANQTIGDLHAQIIDMEDDILEQNIPERGKMASLRKKLILLRRYFTPQRDILAHIDTERFIWINDNDRSQINEIGNSLGRGLEDLDASIARTTVIVDEISAITADKMNHRLYMMSLLAMVFFPANLLIGLFATNLTGTPGRHPDSTMAFTAFCISIILIVAAMWSWVKRRNWV